MATSRHIFRTAGIGMIAAFVLLLAAGGCNKDTEHFDYTKPQNLAVTSFSFIADPEVPGLDSAYFSIDLEHKLIFNADSLRKGTDVSNVLPKVTFNSEVSEAVFEMSGGKRGTAESDYKANPLDSVDFSGDVYLRVKADDSKIAIRYRIKVNIHNVDSDSLYWDKLATAALPSRLPNPKAQKTVKTADGILTLIEEADGSYTKATAVAGEPGTGNLEPGIWNREPVIFPFRAQVNTLTATGSHLYMLDDTGKLYEGNSDASGWTEVTSGWTAIMGAYGESVTGLRTQGGGLCFAEYPAGRMTASAVPADFPVSGASNLVTLANKWTSTPVAFMAGGRLADGTLTQSTWAFDGNEWIKLSEGGIPALEGASLIPYYNYRASAGGKSMIEYKVWMLTGGRLADGTLNRTVYISYDNGVNWTRGGNTLQLPEVMPSLAYCDNLVIDSAKEADLSDAWTRRMEAPRRVATWSDGYTIHWECPYIYLFGGYEADGTLNTEIWRGVLSRLTFTPII